MAKRNIGGKRNTTASASPSVSVSSGSRTYTAMTSQEASQIRSDVDDRYNANVKAAVKLYISDATNPNGYSDSQDLNYALDNGKPLDDNLQFIDKYLESGMHNLGKDTILYRASHDDALQRLGIADYTKLTEQQLANKLVGGTIDSDAYMSFSYDKASNPFIPGNKWAGTNKDKSGGREIMWEVKAKNDTKVVFGARSQTEVIANKHTKYNITGVHYSNNTASRRGAYGSKRVLIIEAEVE